MLAAAHAWVAGALWPQPAAVLMAAVVGIPHAKWGEAVHAEVILRNGVTITADELIALAKARLGSYKAPKSLIFVDELPTSVAGKVLRRQVREKYWQDAARKISWGKCLIRGLIYFSRSLFEKSICPPALKLEG